MYFDYDTVKREQTDYETATTFWAYVFLSLEKDVRSIALQTGSADFVFLI